MANVHPLNQFTYLTPVPIQFIPCKLKYWYSMCLAIRPKKTCYCGCKRGTEEESATG